MASKGGGDGLDHYHQRDRETLKRIVAVLLSLAALAELASSKPRPLRAGARWFLAPAEMIARDFVMGLWEDFGDRSVSLPACDADDAVCLAHSFRALAGLLGGLMRCGLASPLARTRRCLIGDQLRKLRNLSQGLPLLARMRPDTS
ncbi:hypothetical protein [Allomesorhizobium alhagi]|jgi:hypothetical protein|uniref:Uncharacterized protein n=1 Tax=Mesorhizobium alhagi CCNWXJ12-2 TaxID=1107882 RepID=H0HTL8_9HYPH|nr:hypothetical protein [Mesorhizobium alhagi]EHK55996.1 hypothetical protein MAXJ12_17548 [Mesorhizobium alhagi CCNWXJ12-2]